MDGNAGFFGSQVMEETAAKYCTDAYGGRVNVTTIGLHEPDSTIGFETCTVEAPDTITVEKLTISLADDENGEMALTFQRTWPDYSTWNERYQLIVNAESAPESPYGFHVSESRMRQIATHAPELMVEELP